MYQSIHKRLNDFIEFKKIDKKKFGVKFNASKSEISNWTSSTKMNMYRIADMSNAYPELDLNWLLTGRGQMIVSPKKGVVQAGDKNVYYNKEKAPQLKVEEGKEGYGLVKQNIELKLELKLVKEERDRLFNMLEKKM